MKKYLVLLVLFIIASMVKAETYQVEVLDYKNYFEVRISSSKSYSSPRYLKPTQLYIEAPEEESLTGVISMIIEQDPNIESLSEPGQDVGCIEFSKGICLPKINIGEYQLIIDEVYYGIIYVTDTQTYLSNIYEINYPLIK